MIPNWSESVVVFSALQVLDAFTTHIFLQLGVEEANPFVNFALENINIMGPFGTIMLMKGMFIPPLAVILYHKAGPVRFRKWFTRVFNPIYFGVVCMNLYAINYMIGGYNEILLYIAGAS